MTLTFGHQMEKFQKMIVYSFLIINLSYATSAKAEEAVAAHQPEYTDEMAYHDKAVRDARQSYDKELKKQEEAERVEYERRQAFEAQKKEYEAEVEKYRKQQAELRFKQEKTNADLGDLKAELAEVQRKKDNVKSDIEALKVKDATEDKNFEAAQIEFSQSKKSLNASYEDLEKTRLAVNQKIFKSQMEMQKFRNEIAANEVAMSRAENDKVRILSEEIRVRTEWAQLNAKAKEVLDQKKVLMAELSDLTRKLDIARKDYQEAKKESDQADSDVRKLTAQVSSQKQSSLVEMKNLENGIASYKNKLTENEMEKDRLLVSQNKLKTELEDVKKRHDVAKSQAMDSTDIVMETRLAVEKSKGELAREYAEMDKTKLKSDTQRMQIRNLASLAEASDMVGEQMVAQVNKPCNIRREPSSEAAVAGSLNPGQKVVVGEADAKFFKILNSSGKTQFVRKTCVDVVPAQ